VVTIAERISGALIGLGVGDCLGAPVEFLTPERIAAVHGTLTDLVGGGVLGWRPGQGTDDTDQNLAVADAYAAHGGHFDLDDIAARLVAWYRGRPRDVGTTTARALRRLADGAATPATSGCRDEASIANGSLMRALGPGIAHRDHPAQRRRAAAALSAITHAHPLCIAACVVYADVVSDLLHGTHPRDALYDVTDSDVWPAPIRATLTNARYGLTDNLAIAGGAVDSLRLALAALVTGEHHGLEAVLVDVVNRGGDTDTNAAIVGGLLGARHGPTAIPTRWIERLEARRHLEQVAADLAALASTDGPVP
jgi:ADP-ribosyl-[dinitrogen reductase] hydrolase